MFFEAIVDDSQLRMDVGHPMITIVHIEWAKISLVYKGMEDGRTGGPEHPSGFIRKWKDRIPGLFQDFFHFSRTQFLPNFISNYAKKCIFSAESVEIKRRTRFL